MKLSEHFTLEELTRSEWGSRRGITNTPDSKTTANLERLCVEILEPLRKSIGKPIQVTSGYRCPEINAGIGGSPHSDHLNGFAADIVAPPMAVLDLMRAVKDLAPYVPLKQCILEFGSWVHVACLNQIVDDWQPSFLVANRVDGETIYSGWRDA